MNSFRKEDWDSGKGRPKCISEELVRLSIHLDSVKLKLLSICNSLELNSELLSAEYVKNIYLGKRSNVLTVLQLVNNALKRYEKEVAKGSLKNYRTTVTYLEAFCKTKYKAGDILLNQLTYSFIDEFKIYVLNYPLKYNDPCHNNGCMKHLARLKKMISWAYEMRYIDRDVFSSYKIKLTRHETQRLNWEQLMQLQGKRFNRPILNLVADLFLFCCYTGMAPADMQKLCPHQIYKGLDGIFWITYTRAKSNVSANVPLLSQALDIIRKYQHENEYPPRETVFPYVANQTLNNNLKIIAELCDIKMPLHFYMARHTFATTVTLLQGVPVTSIQQMLGHERIESTMIYTRVSTSVIRSNMSKIQKQINLRLRKVGEPNK